MAQADLPLSLEGLDMDSVYENLVKQIAGEVLETERATTLQEAYTKSVQREKIVKRIAALQSKIRNERQLNRQMQMNTELKALKKELEEL